MYHEQFYMENARDATFLGGFASTLTVFLRGIHQRPEDTVYAPPVISSMLNRS